MKMLVLRELDPRHVVRQYETVREHLGHGDFRSAEVSSILSKNEVNGTSPYNRRLFFRSSHGHYILNPAPDACIQSFAWFLKAWAGVLEAMVAASRKQAVQ
jgi:hypothetical protein